MSSERLRGKPSTGPDSPGWTFAHFVRGTVGRLLTAAFRTRIEGAERIPEGGAILAGNHVSYLDPALLWCKTPRPAHFVAKIELWDVGWLGWLLDHFWVIPVKRESADREMIQTATDLLGRGELVAMFPEGTRKRDADPDALGQAHGGVSFIALRADVPVVPVGIAGTDIALPAGAKRPRFAPVTIRIGEPVYPGAFEGGRKERMEAMTAEIMMRIGEVRDEARAVKR